MSNRGQVTPALSNSFIMSERRITTPDGSRGSGSSGSGRSGAGNGRGNGNPRPTPAVGESYPNVNIDTDYSGLTDILNFNNNDWNRDQEDFSKFGNLFNQLFAYLKYQANGDRDAQSAMAQLMLQYLMNEQNFQRNQTNAQVAYERSKAANQVALMMQAGMSRSAALAALQSGGSFEPADASGSISPMGTNIEQNRTNRINSIINAVQACVQVANQIASLAALPFDLKSKSITNNLLTNQNDLLSMQVQGMQDAAMFTQAIANVQASDSGAQIASLPLMEQYAYFQQQSKMTPQSEGFSAPAFYYGNSQEFARAAKNPFFWATLQETQRNRNAADASIFEPEQAQATIAQVRALSELTENQAFAERMRGRIFRVEAFHDEYLAGLQNDVDQLRLQCEKAGITFDKAKAEAFVNKVQKFTEYDFQQLEYAMKRLSFVNDADVFEKWKNELTSSLDYNAAMYIYGASIESLKHGVLQQMLPISDNGNIDFQADSDVLNWTKDFLKYRELGFGDKVNTITGAARGATGVLTGLAATAFAGYKLFGAMGAGAASGWTTSFSSGVPLLGSPALMQPTVPTFDSHPFRSSSGTY